MQDCSISIANALEILKSCTKPSKYTFSFHIIPQLCNIASCWNSISRKTRTSPSHIVNIVTADGLAMPGAWTSAGMVLNWIIQNNLDGLMQERHNSIANALELRLSCTNPSICCQKEGLTLSLPWKQQDYFWTYGLTLFAVYYIKTIVICLM